MVSFFSGANGNRELYWVKLKCTERHSHTECQVRHFSQVLINPKSPHANQRCLNEWLLHRCEQLLPVCSMNIWNWIVLEEFLSMVKKYLPHGDRSINSCFQSLYTMFVFYGPLETAWIPLLLQLYIKSLLNSRFKIEDIWMERWLSSQEHRLLFQRTPVQSPAPTS